MIKRVKGEWVPSIPYTHRAFRPYTVALGELTFAWNDLHVSLSLLFCTLLGSGDVSPALAIWQNITSDRMQRNVLTALANAIYNDVAPFMVLENGNRRDDKRYREIKWICDEATTIENFRNDAVHTPVWGLKKVEGPYITPVTGLGHLRADKLIGKNLLLEFRNHRDRITVLRNYATEIDQFLNKGGTWPRKPKLPNPQPSKQKSLRPRTRAAKR